MADIFTGYINLAGEHIKDGLVNRPKAFTVLQEKQLVELRWLVSRGEKRYEISKEYQLDLSGQSVFVTPERESCMKEGLFAGEAFNADINSI